MPSNNIKFEERWCIEGYLTTRTNLHIGSGDVVTRKGLIREEEGGKKVPVEISSVVTDVHGHPYIPGSTLKGNMRSWINSRRKCDKKVIDRIFGSEEQEGEEIRGGKAEFCNAEALREIPEFDDKSSPPYWEKASTRLTGVSTSVSIERRTKTAKNAYLVHREFVPPDILFSVVITMRSSDEEEVAYLLYALSEFSNLNSRLSLGASCGDGWGQFDWKLTGIKHIDKDSVKDWIRGGTVGIGYKALKRVPKERVYELENMAKKFVCTPSESLLTTEILLQFRSPFLVNDPSKTGKGTDLPSHAPLTDVNGNTLLPAKSIRGALRSQAEKILRTMGKKACSPSDKRVEKTCQCEYKEEVETLCKACKLFGASGWRAPIEFSDFIPTVEETYLSQEFLAIDRFTGGGADGAKFDAYSSYRPQYLVSITIDLQALEIAKDEFCSLGLFALTLRDLVEGDITLGFGASKGYGAVSANIQKISVSGISKIQNIKGILDENNILIENDSVSFATSSKEAGTVIETMVSHLRTPAKGV